ncbi:hypothetical protein [Fluviispira multicolorata]|nr:hypothetical protein [Fluviispira multicolorata]
MKILAVTNNDQAGACIIANNSVLCAVSEERFTRIKDHKTWPEK